MQLTGEIESVVLTFSRYQQQSVPPKSLRVNIFQLFEIAYQILNTWRLQQDGAPEHCAIEVRKCLNEVYPDKWKVFFIKTRATHCSRLV